MRERRRGEGSRLAEFLTFAAIAFALAAPAARADGLLARLVVSEVGSTALLRTAEGRGLARRILGREAASQDDLVELGATLSREGQAASALRREVESRLLAIERDLRVAWLTGSEWAPSQGPTIRDLAARLLSIDEVEALAGRFRFVEATAENGTYAGGSRSFIECTAGSSLPAAREIPDAARALYSQGFHMEAAWALRARGEEEAAGRIIGGLERELAEGAIVDEFLIRIGDSRPLLVRLESGLLAVWKAESAETISNYLAEIAAYRLSRLFGMDVVPVTVSRTIGGRRGSIQVFMGGARAVDEVVGYGRPIGDLPFFDHIAARPDVHEANFLIGIDGREIGVDYGMAFRSTRTDLRELFGRVPRRAVFERARAVPADEIARELSPYLDAPRIEAVIARRDAIVSAIQARIDAEGAERVFRR